MNNIIEKIYRFDHFVLYFIQEHIRCEVLTPIMNISSTLVNIGFIWVISCLIMLCFKKTRMIGIITLSSLALCLLVNNVCIKHIVARARPFDTYSDLYPLIKKPTDYSFASGHTTASFAAAGILARFIPRSLAIVSVVFAVTVAFSRLYLGVHYPTDVICGIMLGLSGSILTYYIYSKKFDLDNYKIRKLSVKQ
ncbi:MAG: phosphatase PAP2 family protein [Clostridia bacterium]|nr:phosphatase PAP2 family protein [Clostridia bacterium]